MAAQLERWTNNEQCDELANQSWLAGSTHMEDWGVRIPTASLDGEYTQDAGEQDRDLFQSIKEPSALSKQRRI